MSLGLSPLFFVVVLAACASAPTPAVSVPVLPRREGIDTLLLRRHAEFLAHDSLLGRRTIGRGAGVAARYITSACRELGLQPVGGRYLHPIPLEVATIVEARMTVRHDGRSVVFASDDMTLNLVGTQGLSGFSGRASFVGTTEEIERASDLDDLSGAVAVTLGTIRPGAAERIREAGATGMVHLLPDSAQFDRFQSHRGPERIYLDDPQVTYSLLSDLPSVVVGLDASLAIARRPDDPTSSLLAVGEIEVRTTVERRSASADNVACMLPGRHPTRRDRALIFTAHYDHLGVSPIPTGGDSIYNGFSDNAAGVAMLLALAEAMQHPGSEPDHSVIFLFLTGEELGLLGSDYWVIHPGYPHDRTVGVINLDAGAPPARPKNWRIAGGDSSALGNQAAAVARAQGWTATTSPATPNSDYFPFWRRGVPAIFIIPGVGAYEGLTEDSSDALRRRWDRYHQLGDEYADDFPFEGLARYAHFAYLVARAWDARPEGLPLFERSGWEPVEQHRGPAISAREVVHRGGWVHDISGVVGVPESQQVTDLVQRHGEYRVGAEQPSTMGVGRKRQRAPLQQAIRLPQDFGLARPLHRELLHPFDEHVRAGRRAQKDERDGDARHPTPSRKGIADRPFGLEPITLDVRRFEIDLKRLVQPLRPAPQKRVGLEKHSRHVRVAFGDAFEGGGAPRCATDRRLLDLGGQGNIAFLQIGHRRLNASRHEARTETECDDYETQDDDGLDQSTHRPRPTLRSGLGVAGPEPRDGL